MMGYGWGMSGGGWLVMGLFWAVLLGLVIWGVARLLPGAGPGERPEPTMSAQEILDRRFAAGEIDAEHYRQARAELAAARESRR